jgi:hypothetical protein
VSWIRDHFTHFVVPTMRAMVRHKDGKPAPRDVKPLDVIVRPAAACKYQESGLVYATISSMLPKQDARREPLLALCRTLDPAGFVGPEAPKLGEGMTVSGADITHSIIWNSLRALKRHSRKLGGPMILPGRDVWPWEVISRRQHLRTIYDNRVSRSVAGVRPLLSGIAKEWPIADPEWDKSLVFDTGWNGSIHRLLCEATQKKPHSMMLSAETHVRNAQLFPGHTGARAKAIAIERFPKYYERATVPDGKEIVQGFESFEEFVKTALLTIWLWHYVSPRHIAALREHAARMKEKQKKHKMQVADAHDLIDNMGNPTTPFSNKGVVPAGTIYGGYVPMQFAATASGGTTPFYVNTSGGTGGTINVTGITNYASTTWDDNCDTDGAWQDGWQKKKLYKTGWSGPQPLYDHEAWSPKYPSPYKKFKVKVNAASILEAAQLYGKEAAQDLINECIQEAANLGVAEGSKYALQGPTGPPVPTPMPLKPEGTPFVDSDGKTKYIIPDKNGMLHKMAQPLGPGMKLVEMLDKGKEKVVNIGIDEENTKDLQLLGMIEKTKAILDAGKKTYVDPNDFKLKSTLSVTSKGPFPVALNADGKPISG